MLDEKFKGAGEKYKALAASVHTLSASYGAEGAKLKSEIESLKLKQKAEADATHVNIKAMHEEFQRLLEAEREKGHVTLEELKVEHKKELEKAEANALKIVKEEQLRMQQEHEAIMKVTRDEHQQHMEALRNSYSAQDTRISQLEVRHSCLFYLFTRAEFFDFF